MFFRGAAGAILSESCPMLCAMAETLIVITESANAKTKSFFIFSILLKVFELTWWAKPQLYYETRAQTDLPLLLSPNDIFRSPQQCPLGLALRKTANCIARHPRVLQGALLSCVNRSVTIQDFQDILVAYTVESLLSYHRADHLSFPRSAPFQSVNYRHRDLAFA